MRLVTAQKRLVRKKISDSTECISSALSIGKALLEIDFFLPVLYFSFIKTMPLRWGNHFRSFLFGRYLILMLIFIQPFDSIPIEFYGRISQYSSGCVQQHRMPSHFVCVSVTIVSNMFICLGNIFPQIFSISWILPLSLSLAHSLASPSGKHTISLSLFVIRPWETKKANEITLNSSGQCLQNLSTGQHCRLGPTGKATTFRF